MKKRKGRNSQDYIVLWVLLGILAVCFVIIGFIFFKNFYYGIGTDKYGDRLDGIESYPLSKTLNDDIASIYKDESSVGSVNIEVEGKIIYIIIDFKESIKVSEAEDLAIKSLDKIGEKNLTFYELQFILTYSGSEENENFPVFGSKNPNSLKVVW